MGDTWGRGNTAPRETRAAEQPLEAEVSEYLGKMKFLWLEVDNQPDRTHDRGYLERNSIALLSNFHAPEPIDPASPDWLGHHSSRPEIRRSGLWNVNHVGETYDPAFLDTLERYVEETA